MCYFIPALDLLGCVLQFPQNHLTNYGFRRKARGILWNSKQPSCYLGVWEQCKGFEDVRSKGSDGLRNIFEKRTLGVVSERCCRKFWSCIGTNWLTQISICFGASADGAVRGYTGSFCTRYRWKMTFGEVVNQLVQRFIAKIFKLCLKFLEHVLPFQF